MAKKDPCKCISAVFTYADDSKNAKQLMQRGECWAGPLIADRLEKSIADMRTHCNISINETALSEAKQVKEIFDRHQADDKLSYKERQTLDSSLNLIEEHVLRGIQRCGGK